MCGIVGLYLKTDRYKDELGKLFVPMMEAMHNRGPDSAGFAIYRDRVSDNSNKVIFQHSDIGYDWEVFTQQMADDLKEKVTLEAVNSTHAKIITDADQDKIQAYIRENQSGISLMSIGKKIEIYKECGTPREVVSRFSLSEMSGSHILGHTRMATESAVTTQGSHPFSTGQDLCLVHNGSFSNHYWWREILRSKNQNIQTENDTEVAAAYLADRIIEGDDLKTAMTSALSDMDGFFTLAVGTEKGFSVMRDEFACKPAVLAETENYVAIASEYQALSSLPGIEDAKLWEPEAGTVYSW